MRLAAATTKVYFITRGDTIHPKSQLDCECEETQKTLEVQPQMLRANEQHQRPIKQAVHPVTEHLVTVIETDGL